MKRLVAGLLFLAGTAIAPVPGSAQSQPDRPPTWAPRACVVSSQCTGDNKPTPAELARVFPASAVRAGADGDVRLNCLITVDGVIRDCRVESEGPKDLGFGAAALEVVRQFSMRPAIRGGKAVAERMDIPLTFVYRRPADEKSSSNMKGASAVGMQKVVSNTAWIRTPTYAELAAAFPEAVKASGESARGTLYCTFAEGGMLSGCSVENVTPPNAGVELAIRSLVDKFQAPATITGPEGPVAVANLGVMIPVSFPARMAQNPAAPIISSPEWAAVPTNADFAAAFPVKARTIEDVKSRVILQCTVAAGGRLDPCRVSSESPQGLGFGEAALTLAPKFVLNPWTEAGVPAVGSSVRIPITYESNKGAPAPAG